MECHLADFVVCLWMKYLQKDLCQIYSQQFNLTDNYNNQFLFLGFILQLCKRWKLIVNHLIMQNSDLSSSLQIIQALNNQLQLSDHHLIVDQTQSFMIQQNNSQNNQDNIRSIINNQQEDEDFLNYSLDQKSISFIMQQIVMIPNNQEVTKQIQLIQNNTSNNFEVESLVNRGQTKKKRRQIFDKYKKSSVQNILSQSNTNTNQFMDTFDEVFKLKSPQKQQKQTASTVTTLKDVHSHPIIKQFRGRNIQQLNIFKKKSNQEVETIISPISNINVRISKLQAKYKQSDQKRHTIESFNVSMEERLSMIQNANNQNELSKDDVELQNILQSQLFNSAKLDYTIQNHHQQSYKNIQMSAMNPSIMIDSNRQPSQNILAFDQIQSRMLLRQKSQNRLPTICPGQILSRNLSQERLKMTAYQQQQKMLIKKLQPIQSMLKQKSQAFQQKRVPKFLRQIRRQNTLLPNFSFNSKTSEVYQHAKTHLEQLIKLFQKALKTLNTINSFVRGKKIKITKAIAVLINQPSLDLFLNSKWEQFQNQNLQIIQQIKPNQNFVKRTYNFQKIQNALDNYLKIADYYLNLKFNFKDERAQKKYYDIRHKFWEIQRNIKLISEDLYSQAIERVIPSHYYEYLYFLKETGKPRINQTNIQKRRRILGKYNCLKQQQDPLTISGIGKSVKNKAQVQLYKMSVC